MLEGEGILFQEDEGGSYINSNVGDDEGKKEYPFITNPNVLAVMRKLYDFHKKQLVHDFINSPPDCPKGSHLSRDCKPCTPGPFYSCPILHESGNDLFTVPVQRKSPKVTVPFLRRSKKRATCRRCSLVTFNHYDGLMCHENYLKECTYAKLRATNSGPSFYNRNSNDELNSEHKYSDEEDEENSRGPCHSQWTELKDFIDPLKTPLEDKKGVKSSSKRRGKSMTKPIVASRYRDISRRRSCPNINAMHVDSKNDPKKGDPSQDTSKNPFPMPDVFEEIYFGQMPESLNSLPVSLQNFKKIQMKMAGENPTPRVLESHKNIDATPNWDPESCPGTAISEMESMSEIHGVALSKSQLPVIKTPMAGPNKNRIRYTDAVARAVDETAEIVLNNIKEKSRKSISNRNVRTVTTPGGKKKVMVVQNIRRKLSSQNCLGEKSSNLKLDITRINKSLAGLTQKESFGGNKIKRKKKTCKLTTVEDTTHGINLSDVTNKTFEDGDSHQNGGPGRDSNSRTDFEGKKLRKFKTSPLDQSQTSPVTITIYKSALSNLGESSTDLPGTEPPPPALPTSKKVPGQLPGKKMEIKSSSGVSTGVAVTGDKKVKRRRGSTANLKEGGKKDSRQIWTQAAAPCY